MERWWQLIRANATSLSLRSDDVGEEGLEHLASVLPQCLQLWKLYLDGNESLKRLAPVLPRCLQLRELRLWSNPGNEGLKHLAPVLPQCLLLRELYFNGYLNDDEGVKHLASVLPQCPQLQCLRLGHIVGDEGVKHLASVLPQCPQLQELNLWGNISDGIRGRVDAVLCAIRSTLALLSAELGEETPLSSFTKRDGDRAVICRVVGFLV